MNKIIEKIIEESIEKARPLDDRGVFVGEYRRAYYRHDWTPRDAVASYASKSQNFDPKNADYALEEKEALAAAELEGDEEKISDAFENYMTTAEKEAIDDENIAAFDSDVQEIKKFADSAEARQTDDIIRGKIEDALADADADDESICITIDVGAYVRINGGTVWVSADPDVEVEIPISDARHAIEEK